MPDFKIFTESKADIKFIQDCVAEHFGVQLSEDFFYPLNSWGGYKNNGQAIGTIRENFEKGQETVLILDADTQFAQRQTEVLNDFNNYGIPVNLFLFPNNNANGNLETLLTEIAIDRKLINCFLSYEQCVGGYNLPLDKSRIYSYLDTLLPLDSKTTRNDLRKEENRNYRNSAHWNLHHEYLQPFHDFLSPLFIEAK